ncbi:ribonuclease J [Candidatus Woesearchaeota archaeon CG10_big_fil_rev_8_21_14_0_10_37_12]|nr:MAG: ribonuclease J [Candidatus Woesearchaeota archaeon CG10_big_fil_rev_8_21_14_0_10_37_12]
MDIQIAAVGGYGEVGRNMTAVKVNDSVVIFDMGLHLPNYIKLTEEEMDNTTRNSIKTLQTANAIPLDYTIEDWRSQVIAIVTTHAHLDHLGAIPRLAKKYKAPVICTPYSAALLRIICRDEKITLPNNIIEMKAGGIKKLNKDLEMEFVHTTHSTLQTIIAVLHTHTGSIIYANDYKLDNAPVYGNPPDYPRLKQLGDHGVLALMQDCIYAGNPRRTPPEQEAKDKLRDILFRIPENEGILVTTFASHAVRLKTITEFGKKLGRKVIFLSRSMEKYAMAAKDAKIFDLSQTADVIKYARKIRRKIADVIKDGKHKYLLVVSGHQGEPNSTLNKMVHNIYPWNFKNDHIIFSSHIIPAEINRKNRATLEQNLKKIGAHIYTEAHVSGHSSREDMRDIINMLKPKHLIPAHGEMHMMEAFKSLSEEMGYKEGKTLHLILNGDRKTIK